jgi:hypothetical protein
LTSVFPVHAPSDAAFAQELSAFLETGCDAVCFVDDAALKPGQDLLTRAETGLSSDLLLLLLSHASNLTRWVRERWEPILMGEASDVGTRVAVFLLEECEFPPIFRRRLKFFNATSNRREALRQLKRWIHGVRRGTPPSMLFSPDLEHLYRDLADCTGALTESGTLAARFAAEAAHDFEAVLWIPAHGKTLAQIAGEIGVQLEMTLDGPLEENCRSIREVLSCTHCLLVLDAPEVPVDSLLPRERTSVLFTSEPVRHDEAPRTAAAARALVAGKRFAEAYEIFRDLFDRGIDTESCARELIWICERWDRFEEANVLRFHTAADTAEQLRLF